MRAYFCSAFALIVFFSIEGAAAQQTPNDTVLQTPSDTFSNVGRARHTMVDGVND